MYIFLIDHNEIKTVAQLLSCYFIMFIQVISGFNARLYKRILRSTEELYFKKYIYISWIQNYLYA